MLANKWGKSNEIYNLVAIGTIEGSCVNSKFYSKVVDFPGNFVL